MSDYLERACLHLGIDPGSVIKHREDGGEYVVIADLGIGGTPKYRVPLSSLAEPAPEAESEEEPEVSQYIESLSYRELQDLAKAAGIAANQSADDLRAALYGVGDAGIVISADEEE